MTIATERESFYFSIEVQMRTRIRKDSEFSSFSFAVGFLDHCSGQVEPAGLSSQISSSSANGDTGSSLDGNNGNLFMPTDVRR